MDKDEFTKQFGALSVHKNGNTYKLNINLKPVGKALDVAQDELDKQVWRDVQRYMPKGGSGKNGLVGMTNAINNGLRGRVYLYPPDSDYGHYQYEGIKYIDPVYHVGGFFIEGVGWRSRKDVKKIPSGQLLKYQDPQARRHWGEVAINNHASDWVKVVQTAMKIK